MPKQFGRQAERKLDERTNPDSSLNRSIRAAKTIERMLNQNTADDIAKGNGQQTAAASSYPDSGHDARTRFSWRQADLEGRRHLRGWEARPHRNTLQR